MKNNAFLKEVKLTKSTVDNIKKTIELQGYHGTHFHVDGFTGYMTIGKKGMFFHNSEVVKHGYDYGITLVSTDNNGNTREIKQFAITNGELWDVGDNDAMNHKYCPIDDDGYNGWFWLTFPRDFSSTVKEYIGQLLRELTGC